jgi:GT2 family glycosyltransferase
MHHKQALKHFEINPPLQRIKVGFTEVHAFLIRKEYLDKINGFDEGVMSTRDHVDLTLNVRKAGGIIYFEPKAIITFVGHFAAPKLEAWEEEFYKLRWSNAWEFNSLKHLTKKWGLSESDDFNKRFKNMGWRRRTFVIKPKIKNIRPRVVRRLIEEILVRIDKVENNKLASDFAKKYGQQKNG